MLNHIYITNVSLHKWEFFIIAFKELYLTLNSTKYIKLVVIFKNVYKFAKNPSNLVCIHIIINLKYGDWKYFCTLLPIFPLRTHLFSNYSRQVITNVTLFSSESSFKLCNIQTSKTWANSCKQHRSKIPRLWLLFVFLSGVKILTNDLLICGHVNHFF